MPEQVKQYTLHQRRLREHLDRSRSLDDLKTFLDEAVIGAPVVVSDFGGRTLDQRKDELKARALDQYHQTLADGFTDDSGVLWSATPDARGRVIELTQRIQEYRSGNTATELPNGKTTVRLRDASGAPHDVTAAGILALAENGDNFKDKAQDRLEEIYGQIDAATTHDELDAIDPASGWKE